MDAKNTIVTSFIVVVCSFVLITAIAFFMSSGQQQQKVDPIINYLHERPTQPQPFGGPRVPFDNRPEVHKAESSLPMIRKLHLVRPDLIHYPLNLRTYC